MSRIFITGDCHGDIDLKKIKTFKKGIGKTLTKEDYLIIAGDFGLIWFGDKQDKNLMKWWEKCPWTTLFIDGNHENYTLLKQYPIVDFCGGSAQQISPSIYHLMRGQIYTLNKYRFFTFGGAESVDRAYRIENYSWWKDELPTIEEITAGLEKCKEYDYDVDYIICHACPHYIRDGLWQSHFTDSTDEKIEIVYGDNYRTIETALDIFYKELNYKRLYFGHYHIDREVRGARCLFNNIYEILPSGDQLVQ